MNPTNRLARFHAAHNYEGTYRRAFNEIRAGRKQTHWMWFIFPQMITVEGVSRISQYYAIADWAEARQYFDDPILRIRLYRCTMAALKHRRLMFGYPDDLKLRSCMTMFAQVADDPALFNAVLAKFFDGPDPAVLALMSESEKA